MWSLTETHTRNFLCCICAHCRCFTDSLSLIIFILCRMLAVCRSIQRDLDCRMRMHSLNTGLRILLRMFGRICIRILITKSWVCMISVLYWDLNLIKKWKVNFIWSDPNPDCFSMVGTEFVFFQGKGPEPHLSQKRKPGSRVGPGILQLWSCNTAISTSNTFRFKISQHHRS